MSKDNFESKCRPKCFWDVFAQIFTNWNVIEKYFRMNFLSSRSAKNDLLSLLCRVRFEAHCPLESPFIYFL